MEEAMICHVCGGSLRAAVTDMPFKTGPRAIVILKELPVLNCTNCGEYLLEDPVMEKVEAILAGVQQGAELEVVHYAA
jgi:YgiT-type zinc finger domain-containing protein